MAGIPDYQTWMKQTAAFGRARSPFLKLLDEAVKGGDKDKIKVALDRWRFEQSKEGKDWRTSVRNQSLAVTNLYRAVNTIPRAPSKEERDAMAFLAAEQAKALMKTFANTKLVFKSDTLAGAISTVSLLTMIDWRSPVRFCTQIWLAGGAPASRRLRLTNAPASAPVTTS